MKIHEYQAKEILRRYGVATPRGKVIDDPAEAGAICEEMGGRVCRQGADPRRRARQGRRRQARPASPDEATELARARSSACSSSRTRPARRARRCARSCSKRRPTSRRSSTSRSRSTGQSGKPVVIASAVGGMDIEEVAAKDPKAIHREAVRSAARAAAVPGAPDRARRWGSPATSRRAPASWFGALVTAYLDTDASLAEINPLMVTGAGRGDGARRQDELRRQRPLPPQGHRRDARPRRREPARGRSLEVQSQLHQARRRDRLHGQRRRPGDGDDGHHQARRFGAGQLPRRRRLGVAGSGRQRLPHPDLGSRTSRRC